MEIVNIKVVKTFITLFRYYPKRIICLYFLRRRHLILISSSGCIVETFNAKPNQAHVVYNV